MFGKKPADYHSGFTLFITSALETIFYFPKAGRHYGLPLLIVFITHIFIFARSIFDFLNIEYVVILTLSNMALSAVLIIARPPNILNTDDILEKHKNIFKEFDISNKSTFKTFSKRAIISIKKFLEWWTITCIMWLLYYSLSVIVIAYEQSISSVWLDILFEIFNYGSTFSLFACYYILAFPSFKSKDTFDIKNPMILIGLCFMIILIIDCSIKFNFSIGIENNSKSDVNSLYWVFSCLSGFVSAAFFSLLISRIDSKIMQVPAITIFLFFIYAAIQSFFPLLDFIAKYDVNSGEHFFNSDKINRYRNFLIHAAFLSKLLLFYVFLWICRKHRLYTYFIRMNDIQTKYPNSRARIYKDLEEIYEEDDKNR